MDSCKKVVAIVGSYRKSGIIDQAVDLILSSLECQGVEIEKIYLVDKDIRFCLNCRNCTQEAGEKRGRCILDDDMSSILDKIESSDAIVIGSPINFGSATALYKRFMERILPYTYWPWGMIIPKIRVKKRGIKAVVVTSSAAPAPFARFFTHIGRQFKDTVKVMGGKMSGSLFIGLAANEDGQILSEGVKRKAQKLGERLIS